jgi:uncharacterized protein with GYD domain
MPAYITLINFTDQGVLNLKDTGKRADAITKAVKKIGVSVRDVYWTLGRFDGVLIFDAPDEETATAALMTIGRMGNVRSHTMRAFGRDEIDGILAKVK